jgi:hypothetical protein
MSKAREERAWAAVDEAVVARDAANSALVAAWDSGAGEAEVEAARVAAGRAQDELDAARRVAVAAWQANGSEV